MASGDSGRARSSIGAAWAIACVAVVAAAGFALSIPRRSSEPRLHPAPTAVSVERAQEASADPVPGGAVPPTAVLPLPPGAPEVPAECGLPDPVVLDEVKATCEAPAWAVPALVCPDGLPCTPEGTLPPGPTRKSRDPL